MLSRNSTSFYGPSDWIRTSGIQLPKLARYQLRYTRITLCYCTTSFLPFQADKAKKFDCPGYRFVLFLGAGVDIS